MWGGVLPEWPPEPPLHRGGEVRILLDLLARQAAKGAAVGG